MKCLWSVKCLTISGFLLLNRYKNRYAGSPDFGMRGEVQVVIQVIYKYFRFFLLQCFILHYFFFIIVNVNDKNIRIPTIFSVNCAFGTIVCRTILFRSIVVLTIVLEWLFFEKYSATRFSLYISVPRQRRADSIFGFCCYIDHCTRNFTWIWAYNSYILILRQFRMNKKVVVGSSVNCVLEQEGTPFREYSNPSK